MTISLTQQPQKAQNPTMSTPRRPRYGIMALIAITTSLALANCDPKEISEAARVLIEKPTPDLIPNMKVSG